MKYTIIIPTWNHFEDCLKPCIESIIKYTDLDDFEILVVANGCSPEDRTKEYVESLSKPFKLIWIDEQIGYTKAMNIGMKAAKGDFLIPFNNDNQLLEQEKNTWIKMLEAHFVNPEVMIAGPWLNWCPWAERNFLIFFIVMIRKTIFEIIGYLDESFAPAYGEDTDFCCRIEDAGYKIAACDFTEYKDGMGLGAFPIYHAGNVSYRNWPGGIELLAKNRAILKERYAPNIEKALQCDGYMLDTELKWLAQQVKKLK
jgi:O-antigen biosynthesis protein